MKSHYFFNVMRKTISQFLDYFDDIKIARFDEDGNITKYIKVPCKFAPKSKHWYWIEKRDSEGRRIRDKILPMIAVNMTNVEYNNERKTNKHCKIVTELSSDTSERVNSPKPFTYSFEVKIAAKYIVDITQILEQILPYFTPTNYIRITIPELNIDTDLATVNQGAKTLELRTVLESSSQETITDIEEADYRTTLWKLQFKVEGYLFTNSESTQNIRTIVQKIYTTDEGWENQADTTTELISGRGHESEEILTWATSAVKFDAEENVLSDYEIFTNPAIIDYILGLSVSGSGVNQMSWDNDSLIIYE